MQALKEVIDFCAAEQGRRDVLSVPLCLVRLMGSAEGGLFVAQLLAWSEKEGPHVARSVAEWQAATAMPPARLRAVTRQCVAMGFVEVSAPTPGEQGRRCYRVLQAPLLRVLIAFLRGERAGGPELPPTVRRTPARRRLRLPVQARPGRQTAQQGRDRVRRARQAAPQKAAAPLPALVAVREIGPAPVNGNGRKAALNGNGRGPNGHTARRKAASRPRAVRARPGDGTFDAQRWEQALAELSRKAPADVYARWLAGSRFAGVEGGTVIVAVDDMNTAWWLNTRLSRVVERAVNLAAAGQEWLAVEARVVS